MVRVTTRHTKRTRLVLILWAFALTSALALFTARLSAQATPRPDSSFVEAAPIISALESGNRPNAADGAWDLSRGDYWDTEALARWMDAQGLSFEDVNRPKRPRWSTSRRDLLREVSARKGP